MLLQVMFDILIFQYYDFSKIHLQKFVSRRQLTRGVCLIFSEYGMGGEMSMAGDVYSFGILLLEMFTTRRPTDSMFNDGLNLHEFSKMALPGKVTEIVDPSLLLEVTASNSRSYGDGRVKIQKCLDAVARIGVLCSMESPAERLEMTDAVAKLCDVRENFIRNRVR